MKTPEQVLQSWLAAYNNRDAYALIELYHDDAINHQVALGEPLKGREALLKSFVAFFNAFPDNYTHAENLFVDGEWAMVEWNGGGTFLGELDGNQPTGRRYTLRGCGFFHVADGKIRFQRGYIDKHTWFSQIGLPLS
ncbi:MAG: ester cyclase [Leptolyngbya sp. BL-A-14]